MRKAFSSPAQPLPVRTDKSELEGSMFWVGLRGLCHCTTHKIRIDFDTHTNLCSASTWISFSLFKYRLLKHFLPPPRREPCWSAVEQSGSSPEAPWRPTRFSPLTRRGLFPKNLDWFLRCCWTEIYYFPWPHYFLKWCTDQAFD